MPAKTSLLPTAMDVHGPSSWKEEGKKKKKRWNGEGGIRNTIQLQIEAGPDQMLAKTSLLPTAVLICVDMKMGRKEKGRKKKWKKKEERKG